jgi:SAM-dependent methyltransferase
MSTKSLIKSLLPPGVKKNLKATKANMATSKARRAFSEADIQPACLDAKLIEPTCDLYPLHDTSNRYTPEALYDRAKNKMEDVLRLIDRIGTAQRFLEIGCMDGMVCGLLCEKGKDATGIDIACHMFDSRATDKGATLLDMSADALSFDSESFDVVFSYDAWEHIDDPRRALEEAHRVLRPGGLLVLSFGPLYMSPKGLHAYREVSAPYCQLLWSCEDLLAMTDRKGLKHDWPWVNGWKYGQYRSLWDEFKGRFKTLESDIQYDLSGLKLIETYPSCFKSKTDEFEDLIVSMVYRVMQRV